MGLFGGGDDVNDKALVAAMRKRLLDEISSKRSDSSQIVNNVYGSDGGMGAGGLRERLAAQDSEGEDPYEYMVDIDREDKLGPDGEKTGWTKKVHRYKVPTGMPGEKKK